ncbi:MAG: CDP-diacylglycerol--glycerol-3-phosphate 3-phosphatidyltransferase [Eggerthellaceae bacterium]
MEQQREKVWTAANIVTLVRLLCIPVFVAVVVSPWPQWFPQLGDMEMWKPIIAAAVFIAISCTDAIDGHLARSRNEVTTLGKFMDPLADKILVAAALLCLIELNVLPSWPALIILAREFIVSGIRMVAASEGVVIAASWWGKVKTVTQIIAVVLFLIKASPVTGTLSAELNQGLYVLAWIAMSVALIFTIVSMLDYFAKARTLLGFSESPRAKKASSDAVGASVTDRVQADEAGKTVAEGDMLALASQVIDTAREAGKTIGTAESLTGGLIGGSLTSVPGSSDVTEGGIISYSNGVKSRILGVSEETLHDHGAVSGQTACQMAEGARNTLGVDVAVSVTGIAGPGGAVPGKPVGTVWIGVSDGARTVAKHCCFDGNREQVRIQTVQRALELMLACLKGEALSSDSF